MGLRLERPHDHLPQSLGPHGVAIPVWTRPKDIRFPVDMVSVFWPEEHSPDIARGAVAVDTEMR